MGGDAGAARRARRASARDVGVHPICRRKAAANNPDMEPPIMMARRPPRDEERAGIISLAVGQSENCKTGEEARSPPWE